MRSIKSRHSLRETALDSDWTRLSKRSREKICIPTRKNRSLSVTEPLGSYVVTHGRYPSTLDWRARSYDRRLRLPGRLASAAGYQEP